MPEDYMKGDLFGGQFESPFDPGDPSRANNGINMQNGRVEPQSVSQAYDFYFMPGETKHKHRHHHGSSSKRSSSSRTKVRREHRGLPLWSIILIAVLGALLVAGGICALLFWRSAQTVSAQASAAVSQATEIKSSFKEGDFTAMNASVQRMSDAAKQMRDEVNGPMWGAAALLPPLSGDIQKIRTLADIFCDLVDEAATPLIASLDDRSLSDVLGTEGSINIELLKSFITGLENAAAVIDRDLAEVDAIGPASIGMVNERMEQARSQMKAVDGMLDRTLEVLRPLPAILGEGGTRRYVVLALQPADPRASGGHIGCVGVLELTNGAISLSDFHDYIPNDVGEDQLPLTFTDELTVFGEGIRSNPSNATMTPDFPRAANLFSQAWVRDTGVTINGVIGVDPVFLQWCLRYVGSVSTSHAWNVYRPITVDGEEVEEFDHQEVVSYSCDGKNTSEVLSHTIYMQVPELEPEEALFSDIAHKALDKFMHNLDKVGFSDFIDLIRKAASEYRLKIFMYDENEELTMRKLGLSGVLQHLTEEAPELGVYVNDYSWGMMGWYLDLNTTIGEGVKNADGSSTYPCVTTVHNAMTVDEMRQSSAFVYGVNPARRNDGDLCSELLLLAPAGGTISDVVLESSYPVYAPWRSQLYGLDLWQTRFWTNFGETSTVTYNVTTSPDAPSRLVLRQTPTCRTF